MANASKVLMNSETKAKYDQFLRTNLRPRSRSQVEQAVPVTQTAPPSVNPNPSQPNPGPQELVEAVAVPAASGAETNRQPAASHRKQKQGSGIIGTLIGTVFGGFAAVGFVGWIIYQTDWIDNLRSQLYGDEVASQGDNIVEPTDPPVPQPHLSQPPTSDNASSSFSIEPRTPFTSADSNKESNANGVPGKNIDTFGLSPSGKKKNVARKKPKPPAKAPTKVLPPAETAVTAPPEPKAIARMEIPDATYIDDGKERIENRFPDLYKRKTPEARKLNLLRDLNNLSLRESPPGDQYAQLSEAVDFSIQLGQPQLFLQSLTKLNESFKIDFPSFAETKARKLVRKIETPMQQLELSEVLRQLTEHGIKAKDYEMAANMCAIYSRSTKTMQPLHFYAKRMKSEIAELSQISKNEEKALKTLVDSADDPKAHESAGDKLFFLDDDIRGSCESWSKCDSETKKEVADAELKLPAEPESSDMMALADKWGAAASKTNGYKKLRMSERAAHWYRKVLATTQALDEKSQAGIQLDEIENLLFDSPISRTLRKTQTNPTSKEEGLDKVLKYSFAWYFKTSSGRTFTVNFYPEKLKVTDSSTRKYNYLTFGRVGDLLIVPLKERGNSTLLFSLRPDSVRTIDYKLVDTSSGETFEMGVGGIKPTTR